MKKQVIGYVGTLGGAVIALVTLASVSSATPNYLVTAVLAIVALAMFGVGWYGLSADAPANEAA